MRDEESAHVAARAAALAARVTFVFARTSGANFLTPGAVTAVRARLRAHDPDARVPFIAMRSYLRKDDAKFRTGRAVRR